MCKVRWGEKEKSKKKGAGQNLFIKLYACAISGREYVYIYTHHTHTTWCLCADGRVNAKIRSVERSCSLLHKPILHLPLWELMHLALKAHTTRTRTIPHTTARHGCSIFCYYHYHYEQSCHKDSVHGTKVMHGLGHTLHTCQHVSNMICP